VRGVGMELLDMEQTSWAGAKSGEMGF